MILSDEERKKHNREKMRKWRKEHPEKEAENREKNREKILAKSAYKRSILLRSKDEEE